MASGTRTKSRTNYLAETFVLEFLNEEFSYSNPVHRRYLKEAKEVTKGGLHADDILDCLRAMRDGTFDDWKKPISSLWAVTWGNPPFLNRWQQGIDIPDIPPVYEYASYCNWLKENGNRAYRCKKWNGKITRNDLPKEFIGKYLSEEIVNINS